MKMNIACYIRVSTQEQKLHGLSLDAQREKLQNYADSNNLNIVAWYEDEGVSGRKRIDKRPALQRMLNDVPDGKFKRIIFIKLDRYFRSVAEYHTCQKVLDEYGVTWTATEEKYDLESANGRAFLNMKLTIAELESDQTGERIRLVNDYKVKTGQPLTGAFNKAFTIATENGRKKVVRNPENEKMIFDMIKYFMTYQNKSTTMRYINKKYNTNMSIQSIGKILSNTMLYGAYRDNESYCEAYISKEEFDKIQEILKSNIKTCVNKNIYLFTGMIKCPICGRNLTGQYSRRYTKSKNLVNATNYRCNWYYRDTSCKWNKAMSERKIEKKLLDNLDSYITEYIKDVNVQDTLVDHIDNSAEIEALKKEQHRLNIMYQKERISEQQYDNEYERIEMQLQTLKSQNKALEVRDVTMYRQLIESGWKSIYSALNKENKRAFWRKYIKEIKMDTDKNITPIFF